VNTPLAQAPEHVKLAVDLIMLLEQHQLSTDTVLLALDIVKKDFELKRNLGGNPTSHIPAHTS
jgi:hypothetical protein